MSVCPFVRPSFGVENFGFKWKCFYEIWYLCIFRKSVEKIQVSLKSDKNNGYFTWRPVHIFDHISLHSSWNVKHFRQNCREYQTTHIIFKTSFPKIVPFMRKYCNMLQSRTGHRWKYGACALHSGCLMLQTHNTLSTYSTYCFSKATMIAQTRLHVT